MSTNSIRMDIQSKTRTNKIYTKERHSTIIW